MKRKVGLIALAGLALAVGCSQVLGLKDPTLEDMQGNPAADAGIDSGVPIDAMADAPPDTGPGACQPSACPFGCDPNTNACRPEKLFVFLTTGAFRGDGFMGSPVDVRGTADTKCFDTFAMSATRLPPCTRARMHAILSIGGTDSIQSMKATYSIPATVPVHRIDDDTPVFNSWTDLTDPTKAPRAAVASVQDPIDGSFWSGFNEFDTASKCLGWVSKDAAQFGATGQATTVDKTWLRQPSSGCNLTQKLLCVCWTGGN